MTSLHDSSLNHEYKSYEHEYTLKRSELKIALLCFDDFGLNIFYCKNQRIGPSNIAILYGRTSPGVLMMMLNIHAL